MKRRKAASRSAGDAARARSLQTVTEQSPASAALGGGLRKARLRIHALIGARCTPLNLKTSRSTLRGLQRATPTLPRTRRPINRAGNSPKSSTSHVFPSLSLTFAAGMKVPSPVPLRLR